MTGYTPDPADVELAIRAAARARYLDRNPGADQSRVDRYVEGMAADRMYRVELSAAVAVLAEAGRLVPPCAGTRVEWTWKHNRFVAEHDLSLDRARAERSAATCRSGFPADDVAAVHRKVTTLADGSTLVGPWLPVPTTPDGGDPS